MGRASSMAWWPPWASFRGSAEPMENSPPGIQTMPTGRRPGGGPVLATIGANERGGDAGGGVAAERLPPVQEAPRIPIARPSARRPSRVDNTPLSRLTLYRERTFSPGGPTSWMPCVLMQSERSNLHPSVVWGKNERDQHQTGQQ